MSTNTTGAELKAFYTDPLFWPEGAYHEDEEIIADDVHKTSDDNIADLPDTAVVKIANGAVLGLPGVDDEDAPSFEGHFKKWRKQNSTAFLSVECPKDKLDAVIAAIVSAGGRVK